MASKDGALPRSPRSPRGKGGCYATPFSPGCSSVGVKGSLRRLLTRSVLAVGCAPHAASGAALDERKGWSERGNKTTSFRFSFLGWW